MLNRRESAYKKMAGDPKKRARFRCCFLRKQVVSWLHVSMRLLCGNAGQGTVEYAFVVGGLLSIVVACGALWHVLDAGLLVDHALMSASHHVQAVAPGSIADIFVY